MKNFDLLQNGKTRLVILFITLPGFALQITAQKTNVVLSKGTGFTRDKSGSQYGKYFDSLNITSIIKGTSFDAGNGDVTTGDASPGGLTPVQKTNRSASGRDGRSGGAVLPVQLFTLSGNMQKNNAFLTWKVMVTENVDHFEIERNINNGPYTTIAALHEAVKLNELQNLSYTDNVYGMVPGQIMYRINILLKSGRSLFSNIVRLHGEEVKRPLTIAPNPAADCVSVKFYAEKNALVNIRLSDNSGKNMLLQKQAVTPGNNVVKLINLNKISEGVYTVQMVLDGQMITEKLMLLK